MGHWNLTTDILHNLRNAKRIPFHFIFYHKILPCLNGISLKISCLFLMESSHDNKESSRYIEHDCSHMLTTAIDLNLGAIMTPKKD